MFFGIGASTNPLAVRDAEVVGVLMMLNFKNKISENNAFLNFTINKNYTVNTFIVIEYQQK